jgi:hypothetical protein
VNALQAAVISSELLSRGKVLNYKSAAGFQQGSKRPDDQFENKLGHGPNLARYEIANNSERYGFPRIAGHERWTRRLHTSLREARHALHFLRSERIIRSSQLLTQCPGVRGRV